MNNTPTLYLRPYKDARKPADIERFEAKLAATLAIYAEPEDESVFDDFTVPALMRRQAS